MKLSKSQKKKLVLILAFIIIGALYLHALNSQGTEQTAGASEPVQVADNTPAASVEPVQTLPEASAEKPSSEPQKPQAPPAETKPSSAEQPAASETSAEAEKPSQTEAPKAEYTEYRFRNNKLLTQHYEKHGIEMGFDSKESYEQAACDVINDPSALHKTEKEDGDTCYYIVDSNEFVVLSKDGYIRTYFLPDSGKKYYDKQ